MSKSDEVEEERLGAALILEEDEETVAISQALEPPLRGRDESRVEERKYTSVSLPVKIMIDVDRLIEEFGYWPSRSAFVREACVEKIRQEQRRLGQLRGALGARE